MSLREEARAYALTFVVHAVERLSRVLMQPGGEPLTFAERVDIATVALHAVCAGQTKHDSEDAFARYELALHALHGRLTPLDVLKLASFHGQGPDASAYDRAAQTIATLSGECDAMTEEINRAALALRKAMPEIESVACLATDIETLAQERDETSAELARYKALFVLPAEQSEQDERFVEATDLRAQLLHAQEPTADNNPDKVAPDG